MSIGAELGQYILQFKNSEDSMGVGGLNHLTPLWVRQWDQQIIYIVAWSVLPMCSR